MGRPMQSSRWCRAARKGSPEVRTDRTEIVALVVGTGPGARVVGGALVVEARAAETGRKAEEVPKSGNESRNVKTIVCAMIGHGPDREIEVEDRLLWPVERLPLQSHRAIFLAGSGCRL